MKPKTRANKCRNKMNIRGRLIKRFNRLKTIV